MELKAGMRLRSAVCDTEVVVVHAPAEPVDVWCGGQPMLDPKSPAAGGTVEPGQDCGSLLGKRYVEGASGIELLCTKGGKGSLSIAGAPMELKSAKPLPSSD